MQNYLKLDVWKKSHELALDVHRLTTGRADPECADIVSDLRRSAASIPVIIVLGCDGETDAEFVRGMRGAAMAVDEVAYLLLFARDAGVLPAVPYAKLEARVHQLRAMLGGLMRTVRQKMEGRRPERAVRGAGSSPRESRPRSTS